MTKVYGNPKPNLGVPENGRSLITGTCGPWVLVRAPRSVSLGLSSPQFQCHWCCQTNEPKHQDSFDAHFYEVTKERHSVRAASRFSLNVERFESDLCELNKL
jgi:hypothetical protein